MDISYKETIDLLSLDSRIGKSHMMVPGPDGKKGFGGSCFPKDINALMALARDYDIEPILTDSAWVKNLMIREEAEWEDLAQVNGNYEESAD